MTPSSSPSRRPRGALAAARAAQQALASGPIRVRIGIHTGTPFLTDDGYVGADVHKAARIATAGHGGQVLMSAATAALFGGDGLRDLGEHRLKDLGAPERLYQVGDADFPPLRTLFRTNLPVPANPLVGRKRELADVLRLVTREDVRLLTVTGPGGVGKTRFVLAAAAEAGEAFPDGTWLVDLTPLRDTALVVPAIGQVLGAEGELSRHLARSRALLVLDNFEQVVEAAAEVASLLSACPGVRFLVTSREPLRVAAEREYPLRPLPESPAVELFRQRAAAAAGDGDVAYEVAAEICKRVDSLPLAIELAAARVKVFDPETLLARLEQRLPVLVSRARDLPDRQRTLHSTIGWSYELLRPEEQVLFRRLASFRGGSTFEAAATVCEADADLLESLVDKSLLRRREERFVMLETIREFALERLHEAGEGEDSARRHADYFVRFAELAEPGFTGPSQRTWLASVADDHENLRSALELLLSEARGEDALRLAGALALFWYIRGFYCEGLGWLERALATASDADSAARAKATWGAGFMAVLTGDIPRGAALVTEALAMARRVGDVSLVARSLDVQGLLAFFGDEAAAARELTEKSVELARRAGDDWCLADALGNLSSFYPLQGRVEAAEATAHEALALSRRTRDEQGIRMALFALSLAAIRRGDWARARETGEEGLAICREIGDVWFTSYFLWLLATASCERGEVDRAHGEASEALELAKEADAPLLLSCALEASGRVARAEGKDCEARERLEAALDEGRRGGVPKSYLAEIRQLLGELSLDRGDHAEARAYFESSLELAEEVEDAVVAARARRSLAALG